MSDLSYLPQKHFDLTESFIDNIIGQYGKRIVKFILDNSGDTKTVKEIIGRIVLEIYYRVNYDGLDLMADHVELVETIAFKILSEHNRSKGKSAVLKFDLDILDPVKLDLFTNDTNFKRTIIDQALKKIGEPGRTLLKLSFHDISGDDEVVSHIHADSIDEMNLKRVRFLDKCVELVNGNG